MRSLMLFRLSLALLLVLTGALSATAQATPVGSSESLLDGGAVTFYVDPDSNGHRQAAEWADTRPEDAALMTRLGDVPSADWFGDWTTDPEAEVGERVTTIVDAGALPVMVFYTIPYRDCGLYSAGGANDPETYRSWIEAAARGIGDRPAVIVLEPDALAGTGCLSADQVDERFELLAVAVDALEDLPRVDVYIDAGNATWHPAAEMARRLERAGIDRATGFALNVSNFHTTEDTTAYGHAISDVIGVAGGTPFVIDTSRNGNGPWESGDPEAWCNPPGRALGATPTTETSDPLVDAWLWVKTPGESDGECRGAPPAGVWYPEYALELARNAWDSA
jgi:endoglucanase